jgi:hypothetical protein
MAGLLDTIYTYRFVKLLATKWTNLDAYKLGIIDKDGNPLKKLKDMTSKEKAVYTPFMRLVFKLKRLMEKIPGGKSATARYGAAILLIKEHSEEVNRMGIKFDIIEKELKKQINEEVSNGVGGVEGKEQPLGKKGQIQKRKKKCKKQGCSCENNKQGDDVEMSNKPKNEDSHIHYQVIGNALVRVDEKKRVVKKRVVGRKRQKKREYVPTKRITRTGHRKLRGAAKTKWKRSHKKAYRKAHTGSAQHKRSRSLKKRKTYAK